MMLQGIRVVDFTRYLPGPICSQRLAELGAEVIKVEPPRAGDPTRVSPATIQQAGMGVVFQAANQWKKSITINQKHVHGRELAFRLAATADVVIEGFRPGIADAMGIGYEVLREVKSDLIYCLLSGYGQMHACRDAAGHDLNYLASSGMLAQFKDRTGQPIHPHVQVADLVGGMEAVQAILAALVQKQLQGIGAYLDVSLTTTMKRYMQPYKMIHDETGQDNGIEILNGTLVSYAMYETLDRRFVCIAALESKFWERFCEAVGRTDWLSAHLSPTDAENPIYHQVKELFASYPLEYWTEFSRTYDCCVTPVLELTEVDFGDSDWIPTASPQRAPELGEHTESILGELLSLSKEDILDLRTRGVI